MNKISLLLTCLLVTGCNAQDLVTTTSNEDSPSPSTANAPVAPATPDPPAASNQAPSMGIAASVNGAENSLMAGDLQGGDSDGDSLTFSCTGCPAALVLNVDGTFTWTPSYDDAGTHSVTFTVDDGTVQIDAMVDLIISNTNRAPTIGSIATQNINENDSLDITPVTGDPDGDSVTLSVTSTLPTNASFDGTKVTFNPDSTQAGNYNIDFEVDDGDLTATESVAIAVGNVNAAPTLDAIGTINIQEGEVYDSNFTASDSDGDSLTYRMYNADFPSDRNWGEFKAQFYGDDEDATTTDDPSQNRFKWRPMCGVDAGSSFTATFEVSDGSLTDEETVTVNVLDGYCANWSTSTATSFNPTASSVDAFVGTATHPQGGTMVYEYTGLEYMNGLGCCSAWAPSFNSTTRRLYITGVTPMDNEVHFFQMRAYKLGESTSKAVYRWIKVWHVTGSVWSVSELDKEGDWHLIPETSDTPDSVINGPL